MPDLDSTGIKERTEAMLSLYCLLTFPHANANAPGQVQQCDPTKIICHSSQRVAGGQTDGLAVATRVWETKSRRHRSDVRDRMTKGLHNATGDRSICVEMS